MFEWLDILHATDLCHETFEVFHGDICDMTRVMQHTVDLKWLKQAVTLKISSSQR